MLNGILLLSDRRQLGRFNTPRPLSQGVVDWAIRSSSNQVLEPSCGSGVFVQSVLHRLKRLGNAHPEKNVWACDIDGRAIKETVESTGLPHSHAWQRDFLSISTMQGVNSQLFDAVVGNPPYVSLHRMSDEQRQAARVTADRLGIAIDRKASLWAYFVVAGIRALRHGGRLGMILPEAALHVDYARALIRQISILFEKCELISIRERCFLADGASERVVLLLADAYGSGALHKQVYLQEVSTVKELLNILPEKLSGKLSSTRSLNGHVVPHFLPNRGSAIDLQDYENNHCFGDFAELRIGVVTGANRFYLLSEGDRRKWKLPENALVPVLSRFRHCTDLTFSLCQWQRLRDSNETCWLLVPRHNELRKTVSAYLKECPASKEANRTFQKRIPWYRPTMGSTPDGFLRYMGAYAPRLALNSCGATCTNTIHRVYFRKELELSVRKAIAVAMHSTYSQLSAEFEGRAYGSGVLKLEPSEALRVRLLLPHQIDTSLLSKYFLETSKHLAQGELAKATGSADAWLLANELISPRELRRLRKWLDFSVTRRTGDLKPSFRVHSRHSKDFFLNPPHGEATAPHT